MQKRWRQQASRGVCSNMDCRFHLRQLTSAAGTPSRARGPAFTLDMPAACCLPYPALSSMMLPTHATPPHPTPPHPPSASQLG